MHNGNVICTAEGPAVIDTETLLCAKAEGMGGAGEFSLDYGGAFPGLQMSVGECMVLPRFYGFMQTSPLVLSEECRPEGFEEQFTGGFREGYRRIGEKKEALFALLEKYEDAPFRYLLRSTQSYAVRIWLYDNAKDDEERGMILKKLEKGLLSEEIWRWEPVLRWERRSIREGDIPYFCLYAGHRALYGDASGSLLIEDFLDYTPAEYAKMRIGRFGEADLAVQCAYIKASLKHIDGWIKERSAGEPSGTDSRNLRLAAGADGRDFTPASLTLTREEAVAEVEEALYKLWEERIPLQDDCCIWHTPMIRGRVGSLFGLAEGFSGPAVFVNACADSPLITGDAADLAKELSRTCFHTLAAFAEYLLAAFPEPPEESAFSRRFNGGFDFPDGLAGLLWSLKQCGKADPERTARILDGFGSWPLSEIPKMPEPDADPEYVPDQDCLEGGNAGAAWSLIYSVSEEPDSRAGSKPDNKTDGREALLKAGSILKRVAEEKSRTGCYKVFMNRRRQYFLPAFLRGSTGIAFVMLKYAEKI